MTKHADICTSLAVPVAMGAVSLLFLTGLAQEIPSVASTDGSAGCNVPAATANSALQAIDRVRIAKLFSAHTVQNAVPTQVTNPPVKLLGSFVNATENSAAHIHAGGNPLAERRTRTAAQPNYQ
ncbi:hypothetical protein PQS90_01335 [Pseudomonas sp. BLCC-B13]|uniref:hypothetical protein n=1 Tax=Pseudomonas sp. BLCC-B13 TaxID=3025314 RepID=UPI00234EECDE|nr:hypothetical protein [Pseudomonas sp. BLCC-B13]MDC7823779.1 hypothetical protein [Pseudomonas sp. BLCC-B13]